MAQAASAVVVTVALETQQLRALQIQAAAVVVILVTGLAVVQVS
jgi:hypothetical protein